MFLSGKILRRGICILVILGVARIVHAAGDVVALSKQEYLDKCRGAWAGQMIGVCFGDIYEFKALGEPITEALEAWRPARIHTALFQDDLYVEMTFLQAIDAYGIDITFEQAGHAFALSQYPLWHANRVGRDNVRKGIMPPLSGHPDYNFHADDIDFQIQADLFGIVSPGLPQEAQRLCNVFGRITNYGDGLYGGMFIAAMYAAAYFEEQDVLAVVRQGLKAIPEASLYHQCISDVIRWWEEHPEDWLAAWHKVEEKWQDDVDCAPGKPFNIDAKLNGAYVVMGLLYGNGDMARTLEIATRCGQDADCNASSAAGILGCMKGFAALDADWTSGLAAIKDAVFSYTSYSFETLIPACQRIAETLVKRSGGTVTDDAFQIRKQAFIPPTVLEQWIGKRQRFSVAP